jgi:hypothetical protein
VDEQVLEKLKLNIRSMLESQAGKDKALLDLCLDVIYHPNMKAFGLQQLVILYINWKNKGNENLGMTTLVHGALGGSHVTAKFRNWSNYKKGSIVPVHFNRMHFFDPDSTNAIRKEAK